jgi:chorismate mutase-like protein
MARKHGPAGAQVNVYFDFGRARDYQTGVMADSLPNLTALRREIDAIDDAMHDLLMRRTEAVLGIAAAKRESGEAVLRPAREAQVLRRLVARHEGRFPKPALVRLWREIMAGSVHVQAKFSLAVYAPAGQEGLLRLAHDQFGAATPSRRHNTILGVLAEVSQGSASAGILPLPEEEEAEPWWPSLMGNERVPRIVARLPFVPGASPDGALAVALVDQEKSGGDRSYIVLDSATPLSRDALTRTLTAAGLPPAFIANRGTTYLAEIDDFVPAGDPRLARVGAVAVGGYAVPFTAAEMTP